MLGCAWVSRCGCTPIGLSPDGVRDTAPTATGGPPKSTFVGSVACESCHRILRPMEGDVDGQRHCRSRQAPSAVLGDFSTPNPLVTFTKEDVAFIYGTKWKQRYFTKRGDDYFVFPAQWDVQAKTWRRYYVEPGTDWWADIIRPTRCSGPPVPSATAVIGQLRHQDEDGDRMERRL